MSPLQVIGIFALAITVGCALAGVFLFRAARRYPTHDPIKHFKGDVP